MTLSFVILLLAGTFGFLMAWGMGANDVANAMGTSVGSRAVTIKQAIIIAAIFEFLGALLAGGNVTATISHGIADMHFFFDHPLLLVDGMLASLLAAAVWLLLASFYGWPVSTTHSIVGAIVGFTLIALGPQAIHWSALSSIVIAWLLSPFLGLVIAYILFMSVYKLILDRADPFAQAKRYVPFYVFSSVLVTALVTMIKGLTHLGIQFSTAQSTAIAVLIALIAGLISWLMLRHIHRRQKQGAYYDVERAFSILMIFTACSMAFAHGSNDVANAVGPMAAIDNAVTMHHIGEVAPAVPLWVLWVGAIGLVSGLMMYGHKVMATVGSGITQLTPSRGFAATFAAAITVVVASGIGLPISTTHTLVGGVMGVGLARGIGALNLNVIRSILISWVVTLPAGALLAMIFFTLLKDLIR